MQESSFRKYQKSTAARMREFAEKDYSELLTLSCVFIPCVFHTSPNDLQ
jgi:hypothetical protein